MTFEEWWSTGTYGIAYDAAKAAWEAATKVDRERCAAICDNNACDYTRPGAEACARDIRAA